MKENCFFGLYAGKVAENRDPEKAFRLQLQIPSLLGDAILENWALPVGIPNGKFAGFLALPKIGENVWVQFENGNIEYPLWQYGCFRLNEAPQYSDETQILQSANGNQVIVSDADDTILIHQKDGTEIKVSSEGVFLGKESVNLKSFLTELFELLETAKVITALGPQTFTPDTLIEIQTLKAKITQFLT
jgi:phage baseplate assembly protein gpV